jgi:serine/threonine protein kinase
MSSDAAAEEQFGPYLVYERLGVGGMATVHRALEQGAEGFERVVALKRLLPHLAEDASFIKSFVREAKLASILNHVNIVQIYELGRVGTEYFISMEYIDGRDLRRILRHARKVTGPPPLNVTVGLMLQLCDALDYAHTKVDDDGHPLGLVHRDISPSNLLVTSSGHVKIIDFGIAKAQSSQLRTHTGRVKGKLAYMAPEAVSGSRDLDARSDIWATGVILHELLTARPLFASKNEYQTLLKVQRGDIVPPSTFNQACPPELDAIVFRALARDADERYANATELRDALMALKRQYALQTGFRDISGWLDWAFGLEQPPSFSADSSSGVMDPVEPAKPVRHKTPRPARNTEEDEACEVVWGGANVESENGPVVLDDVPDVSEKHQRPRRDTEGDADQVDDIPTPLPSHGTMPSIYGSDGVVLLQQPKQPSQAVDGVVHAADSGPARSARGSEQMRAHRSTSGPHTVARGQVSGPHTVSRSVTGPHLVPRASTTGQHQAHKSTGPMPALDTPLLGDRMAAQRARDTGAPEYRREKVDTGENTNPSVHRLPTEPSRPIELPLGSSDVLRADDDDRAFAPSAQPTKEMAAPLPLVRFTRQPSTPPETLPASDHSRSATTPGIAPVRAASPSSGRPIANIRIGESIAARSIQPKRTWLYVVGGLVLVAGTAAAIGFATSGDRATKDSDKAVTRAVRETGTVKFVTEPADAAIRIAGNEVHAGSPWASELPAGVHQIEIHRKGYKSWLTSIELSANETQTLRVVLEPLTSTVGDATLTISTTPSGLEVVIDGYVQAQRTPFKSTLKAGPHKITVRQNGVDVWTQSLDAEASSDYEFNPSFTADKQRERAQRTSDAEKPAAAVAPAAGSDAPAKGDQQDPSPDWIKPTQPPTAVPAVVAPSDKPTTTAIAPPPTTTPPPAPAPKPPAPTPAPTPKAPAITAAPAPAPVPARMVSPKIVPPTAVKKLSGDVPSISKFRNMELPPSLAAKVCIDETGKVSFAEMVTKLDRRVATELTDTLRSWRYATYVQNGVAIPACFVVTFRAK